MECLILIAALASALEEDHAPARRALLVGIADYPTQVNEHEDPDRRITDLYGPPNDLRLARESLARFGFGDADIRQLVDEDATKEGIVRAFHEWLVVPAGPETQVVFWYSGHGSRIEDESGTGAEDDEMDSTFLAWDSRIDGHDGENDLTDDELHSLLQAVAAKTPHVVMITDCCHSTGIMRGTDHRRARAAAAGRRAASVRPPYWPDAVPRLEDRSAARRDISRRYVHVAASGSAEAALELPRPDGVYGALTLALHQAMATVQPGATWKTVVDRAEIWLERIPNRERQKIHVEGAIHREVFGARFLPAKPGFSVRWDGFSDPKIEAGWMAGVVAGATYRVETDAGDRLGLVRTGKPLTRLTTAQWVEDAPEEGRPGVPLRAIELSRPANSGWLGFAVTPATLQQEICSALDVEPANSEWTGPTCRLSLESHGANSYVATLVAPDGRVLVRDARIPSDGDRSAAIRAGLYDAVKQERRYQLALALSRERGEIEVRVRVRETEQREVPSGYEAVPVRSLSGGPPSEGSAGLTTSRTSEADLRPVVTVVLENPGPRAVYVALVSVCEDRQVLVLLPRSGVKDNRLLPGKELTVPITVEAEAGLDRPTRDRFVAIATRKYVDLELLQQGTSRGTEGSVPMTLRYTLDGSGSLRGMEIGDQERRSFGVDVVDLFVSEEPIADPP